MTMSNDPDDFGTYHPSERERRRKKALTEANAAFIVLMTNAVKRGKERAAFGVEVDLTPAIGAIRIYGEPMFSACGSPAQMCVDNRVKDGTQSAKK